MRKSRGGIYKTMYAALPDDAKRRNATTATYPSHRSERRVLSITRRSEGEADLRTPQRVGIANTGGANVIDRILERGRYAFLAPSKTRGRRGFSMRSYISFRLVNPSQAPRQDRRL